MGRHTCRMLYIGREEGRWCHMLYRRGRKCHGLDWMGKGHLAMRFTSCVVHRKGHLVMCCTSYAVHWKRHLVICCTSYAVHLRGGLVSCCTSEEGVGIMCCIGSLLTHTATSEMRSAPVATRHGVERGGQFPLTRNGP